MPPLETEESDEDETAQIVEEVSDIVKWENAGFKTDWNCYGFEYKKFVVAWRDAERRVGLTQNSRLQGILRSFYEEN